MRKMRIYIYGEAKKRNLKDGTLHIRFLVLSLAYWDEWKRRARTHTYKYIEEKKEKCYGETLLAMITRPTSGCAMARKKKRNKREREFNDENSCWLTCLFAKERIRARCFLFFPCSSFHIHIHKLNRKTICFIFCSCLPLSFPLCYSLFFFVSFIYNVDSSLFYKCEMFARFVLFLCSIDNVLYLSKC
jgi:hypothetical protein